MVGNFAAETGYAWNTIQEYFVAVGNLFVQRDGQAIVCFPKVDEIPLRFASTEIKVLCFNFACSSLLALYRFIREHRITIVYLTDWPTYSVRYFCLRLAGVRRIVVHKRTPEGLDYPRGLKRWIKINLNSNSLISADHVIAISEYVRHALIRVACFPEERIQKIWNGIDINRFSPGSGRCYLSEKYGIPRHKKVIFAYSRAIKYKGIQVLIEAARVLIHEENRKDLMFLYCGDGPDLENFRKIVWKYDLGAYFLCPGESNDIDTILKSVEMVVVPSLWQEPFGLAVIEAMATEKVVIASKVGGIVDIIEDSVNGYLLPAGNSEELAKKIAFVLDRPDRHKLIEKKARATVVKTFDIDKKKDEVVRYFERLAV